MIHAIAAIGRRRELGKGGQLLWVIPEDLARFKVKTDGHPIIMGRKTFESLPRRPLSGRTNIVITRNPTWRSEGAIPTRSVEEAIERAKSAPGCSEIFVIGGAEIYAAALPYTDVLDLTLIDADADADAFFPSYEEAFSRVLSEEHGLTAGLSYRWITIGR